MTKRKAIFCLSAAAVLAASQVAYAAHGGLGMAGTAGLRGLSFNNSGISNGRMYLNNGGSDPFSNPVRSGSSGTPTMGGGGESRSAANISPGARMPMLLPERRVPDRKERGPDVSPLLSMVAALLAVLLVLTEARSG